MTSYSSDMTDRQVFQFLSTIKAGTYRSRRDGCEVVLVKCAECSRMFEDEVSSVKERVIAKRALLCLGCDPQAAEPAFVGLTLQIGWE